MLKSWIEKNSSLVILLLFVISIGVRFITAEYVDIGGDNVWRWTSARDLFEGVGYHQWTHHNMRWAIMMPLWGVLGLLGKNPGVYYILPILVASIGTVFFYLIGRQLHSAVFGVVAALLVVVFPQMVQTGSQNWPSVFQFTSIAIAVWAILAWHEKQRASLLLLAAVFFFYSWGARTSAVYYFPGLLLLIWLPGKNFRAVFIFCVAVGICLAGEWIFFWLDTGNAWGRLGIIKTATFSVDSTSAHDYFFNFLKLKKLRGLLPVFILTVVASVAFLRAKDSRRRALAWFYLIFLFFFLYMVSSFNPIRLAQPIGTRYWCAVAPFGLLLLVLWFYELGERFPTVSRALILVLFAAFIAFSVKKIPAKNHIMQVISDYEVLSPVFAENKPVLLRWEPWRPNWIESKLSHVFGVKRKRKADAHHVRVAMERGIMRALGLYAPDTGQFYNYDAGTLIQKDELSYEFVPDGASSDDPLGAVIIFDRKGAQAKPLPAL